MAVSRRRCSSTRPTSPSRPPDDNAPKYGVTTHFESADWPAIVQRVFGRIDPIAEGGRAVSATSLPNVTVYEGDANFVGERTLEVDGTDDHAVIGS